MRPRSVLRWTAAVACVLAFAAVIYVADDPFLMVGGSDSTSFLVAPPTAVQVLALVAFAASMLATARGVWVWIRVAMAVAALVLGGHRFVVDNVRGELRDTYLAVPVARLKLDPSREGGLRLASSPIGISVGQVGAAASLWLLSPVWLGLDRTALRAASS